MSMASYLLLRSNKKSGPYSLQEIVNFGLKAYDLIWVEGKSAGWRYPSELEELKPYAPAVEEQPFDRFFKKPSQQAQEVPVLLQKAQQAQQTARAQEVEQYATQQKAQVQDPVAQITSTPVLTTQEKIHIQPDKIVQEEKPSTFAKASADELVEQKPLVQQPSFEEQYEKYLPKKSVFVTMPGNKSVVVQKPVEARQEAIPVQPPTPNRIATPPVTPAATITVKENPEAQIKYSQPLDEIKEMYVKTLQERKTKMVRRTIMLAGLKKAAVIAALVAIGVVAGLVINRNSGKGSSTLSQMSKIKEPGTALTTESLPTTDQINQPAVTGKHPSDPGNLIENNTPLQNDPNTELPIQSSSLPKKATEQLLRQEREQHLQDPSSNIRIENESRNPAKQVYEEKPLQTDPRTGERNRNTRNENDVTVDEDKPSIKAVMKPRKSGLESMVSVTSNDYKRVAFGGIRNLELTVTNESKFILDKVTVELQYLKPSEEPLKTELIQFHSVSPNGAMTMKIRDTNRGIKVLYKIIDIQAAGQETALNGF
jgi:hypothetical protein